jgi:hypothetical protein
VGAARAGRSCARRLTAWGNRAVDLKLADPTRALIRHVGRLGDEFPLASWWLTAMFPVYFKAADILYRFRNWQRHFCMAYLSRYFRVGLFGGTASHIGSASDPPELKQWVDFEKHSENRRAREGRVQRDQRLG